MKVKHSTSNPLTIILGASNNSSRASYTAAQMLENSGEEWEPVGIKEGEILGKKILDLKAKPSFEKVDTITLYISPANQTEWYDYVLSLQPRRIIFNPGTENPELAALAIPAGIKVENACTLVLLSIGRYADQ